MQALATRYCLYTPLERVFFATLHRLDPAFYAEVRI
jgi:hypothetical protein